MKKVRRLQMAANEILASYRQAADKRSQIGILADLNAVTKDEIEEVLRQCGEELPEKRKNKPGRPRKEPVRAEEEMASPSASRCSAPPSSEGGLRGDAVPEGNQGAGTQEGAEELPAEKPREAARMSAGVLAEILKRVTEAFPEATVAAEAGTPCAAALTVRWDAWGEIVATKLTIQTKKETTIC